MRILFRVLGLGLIIANIKLMLFFALLFKVSFYLYPIIMTLMAYVNTYVSYGMMGKQVSVRVLHKILITTFILSSSICYVRYYIGGLDINTSDMVLVVSNIISMLWGDFNMIGGIVNTDSLTDSRSNVLFSKNGSTLGSENAKGNNVPAGNNGENNNSTTTTTENSSETNPPVRSPSPAVSTSSEQSAIINTPNSSSEDLGGPSYEDLVELSKEEIVKEYRKSLWRNYDSLMRGPYTCEDDRKTNHTLADGIRVLIENNNRKK